MPDYIYNKNGVVIGPGVIRLGGRAIPTKSSNRGGDTIVDGLLAVFVKSEGLFGARHHVVFSYYYPPGEPDEAVWTTHDRAEAEAVVSALNDLLGLQ
mgnify:CR=1 FL=1